MKKPEKKDSCYCTDCGYAEKSGNCSNCIYNQACSDWEAFLPDEKEIFDIFQKYNKKMLMYCSKEGYLFDEHKRRLTKLLHNRLHGTPKP